MTENPPTICPFCQAPVREKKGISRKTGKPYAFYGCSRYPECDFIWREQKKGTREKPLREHDQGVEILSDLKVINQNIMNIAEGINKLAKKQKAFFKIFCDKQNGD